MVTTSPVAQGPDVPPQFLGRSERRRVGRAMPPDGDWYDFETNRFVGIDVGQRALHCMSFSFEPGCDQGGVYRDGDVFRSDDLDGVMLFCDTAALIAVDSPDALSTAPHRGDPDLAPKFQTARGAEVDLLRTFGLAVPFPTPAEPPCDPWMEVGMRVFDALRADGKSVVETYPTGAFRLLNGGPLPGKQRRPADAYRCRGELLNMRVEVPPERLAMWSFDSLDAAIAAVVSFDVLAGTARRVATDLDNSEIWLPADPERLGEDDTG